MRPSVACLDTLIALLSALWSLAEARASRSRPVPLDARALHLPYGLAVGRTIELSDVHAARLPTWEDFGARSITRYAGLGGANMRGGLIIHLGLDDLQGFPDELSCQQEKRSKQTVSEPLSPAQKSVCALG